MRERMLLFAFGLLSTRLKRASVRFVYVLSAHRAAILFIHLFSRRAKVLQHKRDIKHASNSFFSLIVKSEKTGIKCEYLF